MNASMPLSTKAVLALSDVELLCRFEQLISDSREWQVDQLAISQLRIEILARMTKNSDSKKTKAGSKRRSKKKAKTEPWKGSISGMGPAAAKLFGL